LIDTENRIFTVTGMEKAAREAEEADEIEYTDEDNVNRHDGWKKRIRELYNTSSKRASAIRDTIISAIAIARKRHLTDVVEDLRSALQLHRPLAAGHSKAAALKVLEKYGDVDDPEIKDGAQLMDSNENVADIDDFDSGSATEPNEHIVESFLCGEAMMMAGCLDGLENENANRNDWRESVTTAKTLSRIGALVEVLSKRSKHILSELKKGQNNFSDALDLLECPQKTRKVRPGKGKQGKDAFTDIWVNSTPTIQFVLAQIKGYPHWPARVCVAKDSAIETTLKNAGLCLVSFIGESHLHVVKCEEDIQSFSMEAVDAVDLAKCNPDIVKKFLQCVTMAKLLVGRYETISGEKKK